MSLPVDLELPFFAYGIFRADEIAFPQLEALVQKFDVGGIVCGELLERDGFVLLVLGGNRPVRGDLLWFREGRQEHAYCAIDTYEPTRLYRWETAGVVSPSGSHQANVLTLRSPGSGVHPYKSDDYSSRNDPFFNEALVEVSDIAKGHVSDEISVAEGETRRIFRLQAAYSLLWSAIERYCTLRYGLAGGPTARIKRIADEPSFGAALPKHVPDHRRGGRVPRADDPGERETLDVTEPRKAIAYYYQVRSNIVHRGKSQPREHSLVRDSLDELSRDLQRGSRCDPPRRKPADNPLTHSVPRSEAWPAPGHSVSFRRPVARPALPTRSHASRPDRACLDAVGLRGCLLSPVPRGRRQRVRARTDVRVVDHGCALDHRRRDRARASDQCPLFASRPSSRAGSSAQQTLTFLPPSCGTPVCSAQTGSVGVRQYTASSGAGAIVITVARPRVLGGPP